MNAQILVAWFENFKQSIANLVTTAVLNEIGKVQDKILALVKLRDEALMNLERRMSRHDYVWAERTLLSFDIGVTHHPGEGKQMPVFLVTTETFLRHRREVISLYDPRIEPLLAEREKNEKWAQEYLARYRSLFERQVTVADIVEIRTVLLMCGIDENSIKDPSSPFIE